jgi:hypothetical protein
MTDRSKFEQMLEHLINEDEAKARELFHDIVVAKSREIYEELLSEDFASEEMPDTEPADMPAAEADAGDDMLADIEAGDDMGNDDMGDDDMGGDEEVTLSGSEVDELEDRVVDLEDALDALRDEFESLMGAEEGADDMDMGGDEMDMGDEEVPEMDMPAEMPAMEEMDEEDMDEQFIREYTEKVTAKMGDNGANTKSVVAKANNMGGTAGNLNQSFEDKGKGGTQGGLANPSTKEENFGNVNVPGGKAGVKHLKTVPAGHGAEKKGSKPDSEKSLLGR